jgi:nitrogen fixation protein FixH
LIVNDKQSSKKAGWRVFIYFFTAFIVVAGVNVFFVYKAVTTHTGEVTDNPYQRGLAYNRTLAAAAEEENLGWIPRMRVNKKAPGVYDISLHVSDKNGKALIFGSIQGSIRRPLNAENDVVANFSPREGGDYNAHVLLPFPGQWEVDVVMKSDNQSFHFVKRVVVQ